MRPLDTLTGEALDKFALARFGLLRRPATRGSGYPKAGRTPRETDEVFRARLQAMPGLVKAKVRMPPELGDAYYRGEGKAITIYVSATQERGEWQVMMGPADDLWAVSGGLDLFATVAAAKRGLEDLLQERVTDRDARMHR